MATALQWFNAAKEAAEKCKEEMGYADDNATYVQMVNNAKLTFQSMLEKELAGPPLMFHVADKKKGKEKMGRKKRVGNAPFVKYGKAFKAKDFKDVIKNHKAKLPKQVDWTPDRPANVPKGKCQARRYKDPEGEFLIRVVEEKEAEKYQVYWCSADWETEAIEKKKAEAEESGSDSDNTKDDGVDPPAVPVVDEVAVLAAAPVPASEQAPTPAPDPTPRGARQSRRLNPATGEAAAAVAVDAAAPGAAAGSGSGKRRRGR